MLPIETLLSRVSIPRVAAPGVTNEELDLVLRAGLRASDHGRLKPYRFILIESEAQERLGEAVSQYLYRELADVSEDKIEMAKAKVKRAPTILAVVFCPRDHERIPKSEQLLTAGCAAQLIVTASHMLGLGAIWRTGAASYSQEVARMLELSENEQIVAMIYIGKPVATTPSPAEIDPGDFLTRL